MTATLFHDLSDFLAIPRVTGLRLSPDGTWLAASVQTLNADRKKHVTSIWRIDAAGMPARRLTRSAEGEGNPRFLPDGSLLFTSKRPDTDKSDKEGEPNGAALWLLPPNGGEGRVVATLPGGIGGVESAADSGTIVVSSPVLATVNADNSKTGDGTGTEGTGGTAADDERHRKARKDAGVTAILHETVPVRYWDHDLGPDDLRLFAVSVPSEEGTEKADARDLTPDAGRALLNQSFAVSPDGTLVATGWWQWRDGVQSHSELVLIDVATGKRTTLLSDPAYNYNSPRFSPDGRTIVAERATHHTPEKAHDVTLVLVAVTGNGGTQALDLVPGLDRWPSGAEWGTTDRSVYFTADDGGRHPLFRASATGGASRLTGDNGYYSDLNVASDGALFAVRMAVDEPPTPVRVDTETGEFERLPAPGQRPELPGTLTEITAEADDGHPIRAWLVLPETAAGKVRALDQTEDPRETLDYSYQQQVEMVTRVRRGVADVATSRKRVELRMNQLREESDRCDSEARTALGQGREDLARTALRQKASLQGQLNDLQGQYASLREQEEKLTLASQQLFATVQAFRAGSPEMPEEAGEKAPLSSEKPEKAGQKAPLLLWVHGGPMMSWNNWSWRWNPWLMAAKGYAVLLPDPALSTGYGQDFVQRGYHSWGDRPFRDIMAITDKAVERDDIDETRTGMMGGSYGGYMANWIAGHTGRFGAIVSHAGLWTLDQMFGTTDMPQFWRPQFGDPLTSPEMYEANSPHLHIEHVTTPMLVIHGAKDYRVPFGEALRLWWDLKRHGNEAKFLYFPDENHWILSPGNSRIWYETVFAFLGQHVLGEPWQRPELL